MKHVIAILFTLISTNVFSQSLEIDSLEWLLRSHKSGEKHFGVKHGEAYRLLSLDKYNDTAIFYLLSSYQHTGQADSIPLFFKYLIEKNPNDAKPYIIREEYARYERLSDTDRINNLKNALKINPKDELANYFLGKLYYELFINEHNSSGKKETRDSYSENAIKYFTVVVEQDEKYKEVLRFPLLQLANYLGDESKKKLYETYNIQNSYFPVSSFVDLPKEWETNYSVNVIDYTSGDFNISGVESAILHINWYSEHLSALQEPALNYSPSTKVFRFTYLRTFHNPIVIGIENNNDVITIYWKVCDGAGGYDPGKIIEDETKTLTLSDWNGIESKIKKIKFWDIPTVENELLGTDGSQWILEGKDSGKYHVVDRWCGGEITSICKELIALTNLKIEEIY